MIERFVVPLGLVVPAVFGVITAAFKIEPGSTMQIELAALGTALGFYLTHLAEKKDPTK